MNKSELVSALSKKTGVSKVIACALLDAFQEVVTDELKSQKSVVLVGFGSFNVSNRPARAGRNPGTGEPINIPQKIVATFRPGADLKRAIN